MEQFISLIIPMGDFVLEQKKQGHNQTHNTLKEYMWEVHKRDDNLSHILKREFKFNKDGTALSKRVCDEANIMKIQEECINILDEAETRIELKSNK